MEKVAVCQGVPDHIFPCFTAVPPKKKEGEMVSAMYKYETKQRPLKQGNINIFVTIIGFQLNQPAHLA